MFYLKYRPQKISELDLEEVRNGLARVLSSAHVPHAFLFAGPRGTGKTSAARIIAKAVNCKKASQGDTSDGGPTCPPTAAPPGAGRREGLLRGGGIGEPCNKCSMCKAITAGTALDLIEIDAASNRGIDDIRDLREKIKLAPAEAKYKVYIIDEAHMLTREAFNALLKTLEEPPAHAIFVLCTTEPEKLPATIVSRCLRFIFRKGRLNEVVGCLEKVVKGEELKVEKEALEEIAKYVDGSFRDAQKILEQLSLGKRKITVEMVREEMGKSREHRPEVLLQLLINKNAKEAVLEINRALEGGVNLRAYIEELLELLRQSLLLEIGVPDENIRFDRVGPSRFDKNQLVYLIELFSRVGKEVRTAIIPQLPMEIAIIEWCLGN